MEAHGSINPYNYPAITTLGLARGLVDVPFIFTLYIIYTFLLTLNS